jgi:hypothetical protein
MAKKKKERIESPFSALDEQVLSQDTITIAEVKDFVSEAKKKREDWLNIAERSWNEVKKRNKRNRLYGGNDLERNKRWFRFPLWWSCWKIRQPIVLARLPIPILKDTQGDDPFGRTACVVGERLTRGILKTFDAFEEFLACNDDFLVTNFAWGRAYYKKQEYKEDEKVRLQEVMQEPMPQIEGQPPPQPLPPMYADPAGNIIEQPLFDEFGPYIKTGEQVEIENEEVCFEAGLYSNIYIDPDARTWAKVNKIAFEYSYSLREFKKKFGEKAVDLLSMSDLQEHKTGKPIIVFEYHDKFLKEVRWFAENSESFFQPYEMPQLDAANLEEVAAEVDNSDIYGLSGFFPMSRPLMVNNATDEFWPVPEYFQVQDILDDIHSIMSRMILLTKAIRVRFLFDSTVTELKSLIGEMGEGGGLGIPNLEAALSGQGGGLQNLVAYFPVEEMIQGLNNMYTAFEQRLTTFYQVTGISDLIRGATGDVQKTYGERQMEGKFALNRIEPMQRQMQEWIKDQYQLLMELALKMFSNQSLDEYITPQTLDPEDKQRYEAALELLKSNKKRRFRVDFETDSTVSINEQWKKQQATELANTLTKAMESVAKVAETQPELAGTELKVLKHLIGEFSDGKLFIDEIQDSIEQVIQKVNQPKPEQPDPAMMKVQLDQQRLQLEGQKLSADDQFRQLQLQATQQLEFAKMQQSERISSIEAQLEQFKVSGQQQLDSMKIQADAEEARANLEKEYQKISNDIMLAQQDMALKRDELLVELRKIADKKEVDQFGLMIDERVATVNAQLEKTKLELEAQRSSLDMQERFITEQRLQAEHQLQLGHSKIESLEKVIDVALKKKELDMPMEIKVPEAEKPKKKRKTVSDVQRDKDGNIARIIRSEED